MRRIAATAALLLALSACDGLSGASRTPFKGADVTGSPWHSEARLVDQDGKPRTLADFNGKLVVLIFGYTHCPDVCPTSLADMAKAMKQLGSDAPRVQVLFVSVDPKRDTPELLRQYVAAFDPRFVGLTGDADALARLVKDYRLFAEVRESPNPAEYVVSHSGQMFVLDRDGKPRLMFPPGMPAADMAADLKVLLDNA